MKRYVTVLVFLAVMFFGLQTGAVEIVPISEITGGMKGYGVTVFEGTEPDTFQVEICKVPMIYAPFWGAIEPWPIIWARMSGGPPKYPVERMGPAGGMSGSPIFAEDGRLIGALSAGPNVMDKDAICGITPAELMLGGAINMTADVPSTKTRFTGLPAKIIKTPLYISGLDIKMLEFEGLECPLDLERFIIMPMPMSGNGAAVTQDMAETTIQPGSSVNVYLIRGDIEWGANGTVTWVDSSGFYAFGHPFLGIGKANYEVALSEVVTTVASYYASYKLSGGDVGEPFGAVKQDRFCGIWGEISKDDIDVIDISVLLNNDQKELQELNCEVTRLPDWSFYLIQVVALNVIWSGFYSQEEPPERGSIGITTEFVFNDGQVLKLDQIYGYTDGNIVRPMVGFILDFLNKLFKEFSDNGVLAKLEAVNFSVTYSKEREVLTLTEAELDKSKARPGDTLSIKLTFISQDLLTERVTEVPFTIPAQARGWETVAVQVKTGDYLNGSSWQSESDDDEDEDDLSKEKELDVILDEFRTWTNSSLYIKATFSLPDEETPSPETEPVIEESETVTTVELDSTTKELVWKETREEKKPKEKKPEIVVLIEVRPPVMAKVEADETLALRVLGNNGPVAVQSTDKSGDEEAQAALFNFIIIMIMLILK